MKNKKRLLKFNEDLDGQLEFREKTTNNIPTKNTDKDQNTEEQEDDEGVGA